MTLRELNKENAHELLQMQLQLDNETTNMMYEPGERPNDITRLHTLIENNANNGSVVYLAYEDETCVGFLSAMRGGFNKIRHTAYIAVGILRDYRGKGIGNALFNQLIEWADSNGIKRLDLSVMTHNQAGIALYKKHGFVIEGTKKCAMFVKGTFIDEHFMARVT